MYEIIIYNGIFGAVALIMAMVFFYFLIKNLVDFRVEVNRTYNLAEIGYLRKLVAKDINIDEIRALVNVEFNDKTFRRKLEDKIVSEYFGEKKDRK